MGIVRFVCRRNGSLGSKTVLYSQVRYMAQEDCRSGVSPQDHEQVQRGRHAASSGALGHFFRGYSADSLSHAEKVCRDSIETSSMAKSKASRIVQDLDMSKPFLSRFEFIQSLAALSAMYPDDMNRTVTGANQRLAHMPWCAADSDRAAWLFNNTRWRHTLSLRPRVTGVKSPETIASAVCELSSVHPAAR